MNRREIIEMTLMGTVLGALATRSNAAAEKPHDHAESNPATALMASASRCIDTGERCLSHCLNLLGSGAKEMAGCARTVRDTIAACRALGTLAAAGSPHVRALAPVVARICEDCESECRRHAEVHAICRECADACADCAKLCRQSAA